MRIRRYGARTTLRAALSVVAVMMVGQVVAAPGDLDLTFGAGTGVVFAAPIDSDSTLASSVRRPDGRFVVAGDCGQGMTRRFCLSARLADGSPDTSFNGSGVVTTVMSTVGTWDSGLALALQNDGKLLLTGSCTSTNGSDFCVARYNVDGSLDGSFGTGGKRIFDFGLSVNSDASRSMFLQADGRIVLVGNCEGQRSFCLARLLPNGQLDTSFNQTGLVRTDVSNDFDAGQSGVALADGRIVVGGFCRVDSSQIFTGWDFCLARYGVDGTLDTSFGSHGFVFTPVGNGRDELYRLRLLADGKLLAVGRCDAPPTAGGDYDDALCAVRYLPDGTVDSTFGNNGRVMLNVAPEFLLGGVDLYPDGRLLVSGACRDRRDGATTCAPSWGWGQFVLLRLTANGALDPSFASAGKRVFSLGHYSNYRYPSDVMLLPDGKILFSGSCAVGNTGDANPNGSVFCFARFQGEALPPVCLLDLDGSGQSALTTDALLHLRYALAVPPAVRMNGIVLPLSSPRRSLAAIDTHLRSLCPASAPSCALDLDGDGIDGAATDALIHARLAAGWRDARVLDGITLPANAARRDWATLRPWLQDHCGVSGLH